MLHSLLSRQLRESGLGEPVGPAAREGWQELLEQISRSYFESDQRSRLLAPSSAAEPKLTPDPAGSSPAAIAACDETERTRLSAVVNSLGAGLCTFDADLALVTANPEAARLLECTEPALVGRTLTDLISFRGHVAAAPSYQLISLQMALALGQPCGNVDGCLVKPNGAMLPVAYGLNPILEAGNVAGAVLVFLDITERTRVERALRDSEARLAALVQNVADVIMVVDGDGTITFANPAAADVLGYSPEELLGNDVRLLVHTVDRPRLEQLLRRTLPAGEGNAAQHTALQLRHRQGGRRHSEALAINLLDHPSVRGILLTAREVTHPRPLAAEPRRAAWQQPLARLPNRRRFVDLLGQALEQERGPGGPAVLVLQLDGARIFADSAGRAPGEELLSAAAGRLAGSLRDGDELARLDEAEFALFLRDVLNPTDALRIAGRLQAGLQRPFSLHDREACITASIGIRLTEDGPAGNPDELLRDAELALLRAKSAGTSHVVMFEEGMSATSVTYPERRRNHSALPEPRALPRQSA